MGIVHWIFSAWLGPLPHGSDSSPFYPWPEDWLGQDNVSEPERSVLKKGYPTSLPAGVQPTSARV